MHNIFRGINCTCPPPPSPHPLTGIRYRYMSDMLALESCFSVVTPGRSPGSIIGDTTPLRFSAWYTALRAHRCRLASESALHVTSHYVTPHPTCSLRCSTRSKSMNTSRKNSDWVVCWVLSVTWVDYRPCTSADSASYQKGTIQGNGD